MFYVNGWWYYICVVCICMNVMLFVKLVGLFEILDNWFVGIGMILMVKDYVIIFGVFNLERWDYWDNCISIEILVRELELDFKGRIEMM